jgi:L-asparaginase
VTPTLVVQRVALPALIVHGGAGSYLETTTLAQRQERGRVLLEVARAGHVALLAEGERAAVLEAVGRMEDDPRFNCGYGSRLQRDGEARMSASIMDGARTRLSAVYNVEAIGRPSVLAAALQERPDRNLDGAGASLLADELGIARRDVRSPLSLERWQALTEGGDAADRDAAIGEAGEEAVSRARELHTEVPDELDRYGTVGAVALGAGGGPWACTSTGGRGHEAVGRVSDTPTPAGNYACPKVGVSATGFGEQILDLDVAGRVATRVLDGASLEEALRRTFREVEAHGGLLGVIALTAAGEIGYAHTTAACGVAWVTGDGSTHVDRHGR